MLYLYNTLTKKKELFEPLNPPTVTMYTCGPTVYGPGHLGHARTYTTFDLLKRALRLNGFDVKHVLNITDVHDDMIKEAARRGITIFELADGYIPLFHRDLAALNIQPADFYPRVTEVIPEIIEMVKVLVEKGYAYAAEDGSVYFAVSKFKNYGRLSGINLEEAVSGTRVKTDKYERDHPTDFALWKAAKDKVEEKVGAVWDSPWGRGRPGWHIECSVMAKKFLGPTLDIHAGAMDLKFPHHENEIAQSEAANGVEFARFWVHAGLLDIEGQKMSKSLGNVYSLDDLRTRGFDPLDFRYLTLTTHYRSRLNFTWKGLEAARNALSRLRRVVGEWDPPKIGCAEYEENFLAAVNDDLDMPKALSIVWDLVRSDYPSAAKQATLLKFDKVLGLNLAAARSVAEAELPVEVRRLIEERERLRQKGRYTEADRLRRQIKEQGFVVEDTPEGPRIRPQQNI